MPQRRRRVPWARIWKNLLYWLWKFITAVTLGTIYVMVISAGLRHLIPPLGQRLYLIPFLYFLRDYAATYRLDLAIPFAIFLLLAVWHLWERVLLLWLGSNSLLQHSAWNREIYRRLILTLGVVILGADAALFYTALTQTTWGGSGFSVGALLATVAYVAVIVFVSFVSVHLRESIETAKKEEEE